jgi:hypothetical protein
VGREDREARVLQRDEAHEHPAGVRLVGLLGGVGARGLVAVVAVGDEQLRVAEGLGDRPDDLRVGDPPHPVDRPVVVDGLAERLVERRGLEDRPRLLVGIAVEAEDRAEVRLRRALEVQPVLLGAGCVRSCGRMRPGP